jgi:hypothetical protein
MHEVMPPEYIAILFWYMGALPLVVHAVEMAETRGKRQAIAFYLVAVSVWAAIVYVFLLPYFRALTQQMEREMERGAHIWWALGAFGAVGGLFIAVGMLRDQPLLPWLRPQVLRQSGLVMLATTLASAAAWYLLVAPGVLT